MPNYTSSLNITTGRGDKLSASKTGTYQEIFNVRQKVDNSDEFISLLTGASAKGAITIDNFNSLIIKNSGAVGAEIQIKHYVHENATPDTTGSAHYSYRVLGAGDFFYLSNIRQMSSGNPQATANGVTLDNQVPDSNMFRAVNNVAESSVQEIAGTGMASDATVTTANVDSGAFFFVEDLIRVGDEIMEVTAISGDALTVIRGTHGSTAATHAANVQVRFPFFNNLNNFTAATGGYDKVQTDATGSFKCTNFFGYARNTNGVYKVSMGIVPGSFSIKFYESGFQELGLSAITSSTNSGLAVSTEYGFDLTVDGSGLLTSDYMKFTTDSSSVNWGGVNGIIEKINTVLDTQYRTTSSAILGEKVSVGIVNGDIRFTSGSHLSTSAILLAASSAGETTPFGVGSVPVIAKIESPVAARLPQDTILDKVTGSDIQNISKMAYDEGFGNIKGAMVSGGSINYETGAIFITGGRPDAQFVVSANYGASQSGGNKFGAVHANSIANISARSTNSKIDTIIELIGLK